VAEDLTAANLVALLVSEGATLATAESLSGGLLGARITSVPGASKAYVGGVVTYATDLKVSLLGVAEDVVDRYGVVSAECAQAMADGVRRLTGSTYGLSLTGVAGPDLQEGKPAGTVFVGVATPGGGLTRRLSLDGGREAIREAACRAAIGLLVEVVIAGPETALSTDPGRAGREETSLG